MMTPHELNQRLVGMVDTVAAHLLPNGRLEGHNWCAGSVNGEPGRSLRVCLQGHKAGVWTDFSSNEKGGDLLSLWQQCRGLSFADTLKDVREYLGVQEVNELYTPPRKRRGVPEKPKCNKPSGKVLEWFDGRGILPATLDLYKVGQLGDTVVFPFLSPDGKLELIKYRDLTAEKKTGKKKIWSNVEPEYHLWGWQAIVENARAVVICEGEIDALSWAQQSIPALSVPQGGGDGNKQTAWLENDFDRLLRFETIFISMDMDVAGQAAIHPIVSRLGVERCRIVDLGEHKDASEAHMNGIALQQFLDKAKTQDPAELKRLADYHDEILDEFQNSEVSGIRLPWPKTIGQVRLRPSEISVWAGINSHGKSIALSHVAVDAVSQGEKVCIASMEMKPRKLGRKMYQQIIGNNAPDRVDALQAAEFLGNRVWLFECYGTAKADRIIEVFTYARKRYGVTQFIVDSLAKCGFGEDDYNGQKSFVDRLMEFAGEHNVHVHLVVHIRKGSDENSIPGKFDVKGTSAITDMVHNCFVWWRNKKKEEVLQKGETGRSKGNRVHDEGDAVLNVVKQRETGEEPMFKLYFHKDSCQFVDRANDPPTQYLRRK